MARGTGGEEAGRGRGFAWLAGVLSMAFVIGLVPADGSAKVQGQDDPDNRGRFCSATAAALFDACGDEVEADHATARAICINISDGDEREDCRADAMESRREGGELCREQLAGRREACALLGEDRYDPEFEPASFDDDFENPMNPNPYFPLGIGNQWEYRGGTEFNTVEVLDRTKLIEGVTCIVVRDQVMKDGHLVEDTDDWFAPAKSGDVFYCGEEVKDYETFPGDDPLLPELVSIAGSFKWGRDGDKGGIIFPASPMPGQVYREEASLGNAEDVTEILSTTYAFGNDPELDQFVPQALADLLCDDDCVVTRNFSLLEPGVFARKYYARGIGFFLEVDPDTGEILQLVDCNVDLLLCGMLPDP